MFEIVQGYKQGRAVMFYDLLDRMENKTTKMVSKDDIVKLCADGKISNAKIQWWEGKAIVRCQNKNLPLHRIDDAGNIIGVAQQAVRSTSNSPVREEVIEDVSSKSKVVGKVSKRRIKKDDISFAGYAHKNVEQQFEVASEFNMESMKTVEDIFDKIADDFNLKNKEQYKTECSKKVKMDKPLDEINAIALNSIKASFAVYLMNMAHDEINNTYMKYIVR